MVKHFGGLRWPRGQSAMVYGPGQEALSCPRLGERDLQLQSSREVTGLSHPIDRGIALHSAQIDLYVF